MKQAIYYYNGAEGEEELHEDTEITKLIQGKVIERAGENWKIIEIQTHIALSSQRPFDIIKIYLEGPL